VHGTELRRAYDRRELVRLESRVSDPDRVADAGIIGGLGAAARGEETHDCADEQGAWQN